MSKSNQQSVNSYTHNKDISISGALKSYESMGYSNRNCIGEAIDNILDSGANEISMYTYHDETKDKYYFVTSGNGNGLTVPKLMEIQTLQHFKDGSQNHGRFGFGYAVLRSVFSKNMGITRWLSCHTDLNDNEKTSKYTSGKYAQITIDMTKSIEESRIVKTPCEEINRINERWWEKFAIDIFKTGTVVMVEMPKDKFRELETDFRNPEPEKNILLGCARDYANIIRDGVSISYNGNIINALPKPGEEHSHTKKIGIYECETLDDDNFGKNAKHKVKNLVTLDENKYTGDDKERHYRYYYKNNSKRNKFINHKDINIVRKICTLESIFIHDIKGYFEKHLRFFKNLGVNDIFRKSRVSRPIQTMIITDMICRNNKMILIDADNEKISGDTKQYCCRNDVINIFHLDYSIYKEDKNIRDIIINNIDDLFGINVNKGMVYRRSLNNDINLIMSTIKIIVNKDWFWKNGQRDRHNKKTKTDDTTVKKTNKKTKVVNINKSNKKKQAVKKPTNTIKVPVEDNNDHETIEDSVLESSIANNDHETIEDSVLESSIASNDHETIEDSVLESSIVSNDHETIEGNIHEEIFDEEGSDDDELSGGENSSGFYRAPRDSDSELMLDTNSTGVPELKEINVSSTTHRLGINLETYNDYLSKLLKSEADFDDEKRTIVNKGLIQIYNELSKKHLGEVHHKLMCKMNYYNTYNITSWIKDIEQFINEMYDGSESYILGGCQLVDLINNLPNDNK